MIGQVGEDAFRPDVGQRTARRSAPYTGDHGGEVTDASGATARRLARGLGWFSIGLGVAELVAPRVVAMATGSRQRPMLLRVLGLRELVAGIGILTARRPVGWLWARVAGDFVDLSLLGFAATKASGRSRALAASAAVLGVTALDVMAARKVASIDTPDARAVQQGDFVAVRKSIQVSCPEDQAYRFFRRFESFPQFMGHVLSIDVLGERNSRWSVRGPAGTTLSFETEIVEDRPGERISWRSRPGSPVINEGEVRFERARGGRGTIVTLEVDYRPPGGTAGNLVAKMFGSAPEQYVAEDLRRFKQIIEAGEVATTKGQSSGRVREVEKERRQRAS